jgi:hypothetical protein
MALNYKAIHKTVIDSIKAAIGSDLAQTTNPDTLETYGIVLRSRPNPAISIPEYPYAVLDILGSRDTDWYLTELAYDEQTDEFEYRTHKTLDMQISIFGGDANEIGEKLHTSYRREDILEILSNGGLGLADIGSVQIIPELLQTDWLEASFIQLSIRVNDKYVNPELESIENVILDGDLEGTISGDPLTIHIDTTT